MIKAVLKDKTDLSDFAEKNLGRDQLKEFQNGKIKRPESYPCIAVYCGCEKGQIEFITLAELFKAELDVLNISKSGIVLMKIDDINSLDDGEIEIIHQGLKNHGLSGLLMDQNDEIKELSHQMLITIANSMGFKVEAKAKA